MRSTKQLAFLLVASLFALPAFAASDSDSCGLGWQVTQKKSFLATTTRGTTNSVVPPTFGMTSGTIGCAQHSIAKNEQPAFQFLLANHRALEIEMAQGSGEYLAAFASELGCANGAMAQFSEVTQKNYGQIFNSTDSNSSAVGLYQRIRSAVSNDASLKASCSALHSS